MKGNYKIFNQNKNLWETLIVSCKGNDGVTPKLKMEDNKLYVSYDSEKTWELLGALK